VRVYRDDQGRRCTQFIATCNGATCPNEANSRLIAAAPELLEGITRVLPTLKNWLADVQGDTPDGWQGLADDIAFIEAAIRKAKGQ
jgi:hypothetical protein